MAESHVDEIKEWLEQRRDELERLGNGQLVIDWGDQSIAYDLHRIERVKRRAVRRLAG